jgi:hypothetical protein
MVRVPKAEGRMSSQAEPASAGPIERRTPASESGARIGVPFSAIHRVAGIIRRAAGACNG